MTADAITNERSSRPTLGMVGLTLLTILVYSRLIGASFLNWDDAAMVVDNPDLLPSHWPAVLHYWKPTHPHIGLYAPLTYTLYAALAATGIAVHGSLTAVPFRIANLGLHVAAGWLLWTILRRRATNEWAAVLGVAIFWLHPVQLEPVAWIASLNTVLAGTLVLAAIALYCRGVVAHRGMFFVASCAVVLLASLAKPSVIAAPLAALAIDRWWLNSRWRDVWPRVAAWTSLMVPAAIAGRLAQPTSTVDVLPGVVGRAWVAADALGFYVGHVIAPFTLAMDYGRVPAWVFSAPTSSLIAVGVAVIFTAGVVFVARTHRAILAAAGVFVAGVLPVLGLTSFDFQRYSTVADRYLYGSMAGVAILVTMLADRSRAMRRAAAIAVGVLTLVTFVQMPNWFSDQALFDHAVFDVNPASRKALYVKAYVAVKAAEKVPDANARLSFYYEPIALYDAALKQRPNDGYLRLGVANLYFQAGALDAADRNFAAAARSDARLNPEVFTNWGMTLFRLGRFDDAIVTLDRACGLDANNAQARQLLNQARQARATPERR